MNEALKKETFSYIERHQDRLVDLICTISSIPSPTGQEQKKAEWILQYLHNLGAAEAYIDRAGNVLFPWHVDASRPVLIYNAHIDTVFNQVDTITPTITGNILAAPSCGDNSSCTAGLLFLIGMIFELHIAAPAGILFAFNVGEEGLGNLKGMRHIMETWKNKVASVIAVDGKSDAIVNVAVGSRRYKVAVEAEGGHSWMHFGNANAIAVAAAMINELYALKVPYYPKTTYNIGTISGGTTVNSIAAYAEFTIDLRSESKEALLQLDTACSAIIQRAQTDTIKITATLLGERPCSSSVMKAEIYDRILDIRRKHGQDTVFIASSTDANIALSQGIPAMSFGICRGKGAHTVQETLELDSLVPGMQQLTEFIFHE
ncbi:M20/M25/M40 family metallo-hydrolase [Megasphaera cerevisiae]|uniref:M20/M25/M40 family metallo-hydrolase n=1 Tax=Megasphaera cerevisiae TaxID=39029 RepID=UPI0009454D29|nr:M20/M25/M40 family metallo-hydrolase [Megasphaera cerevisiae]OKY53772.1 peptidase [Megasphaera cerevisiae]